MSVASEITRLQTAKADLKTAINAKTDAQHQIDDETIDDYASFVNSIQIGGNSYSITVNVTNGTYTGATNTYEDNQAYIYITPGQDKDLLVNNISVVGASFTYDPNTKTIVLYNPTSDITITATCTQLYTAISYIENTDSAYINTGYIFKSNTKVVLDCYCRDTGPTNYSAIFGAKPGSVSRNCMVFLSRYFNNSPCYQRTGMERMGSNMIFNQRITLTCEGHTATWTNGTNTYSITGSGTDDDGVSPVLLFNLNMSSSADSIVLDTCQCYARIYECKIYEGTDLVMNLVPKLRENEPGLFDTVSGVFFSNAGTGSFIYE